MKKVLLLLATIVIFAQCQRKNGDGIKLLAPHKKFIDNVIEENNSFYSIIKHGNPKQKKSLAIGVFDSGIGGLTVFDAIINAGFSDSAYENQPGGIKDFCNEQFIYLADQANMPYSNYVEEGKKELLTEHVLKDALFLLNNKYHISATSSEIDEDKPSVKAIVIACNTATAYGKLQVEELCKAAGSDVKVIGVIDAGCKGALDVIGKDENATIAVLATPATVGSMAYVNTLNNLKRDYTGNIQIVQQGGKGLHESIDNKHEFINSNYTKPYPEYQGPSLYNKQYKIVKRLLPYYNFDTTNLQVLYNKKNLETSDTIQINSVENYTRYYIVSLMEQLRGSGDTIPLKAIILGCTHYPYVSSIINDVLEELRKAEQYKYFLADSVYLIDPAINTAKELYRYLSNKQLFNDSKENRVKESRFFLSVPNIFEPDVETGTDNRFTYEYQYRKREINELKDFTLIVPFSEELISGEQIEMIKDRLPSTYGLLKNSMDKELNK